MIKTKIALAVLLTTFALAPADAAKSKKPAKAKTGTSAKAKAKPGKVKAPVARKGKGRGKAAVAAAAVREEAAAEPVAAPVERSSGDRRFNTVSIQFLGALWRMDPESAIYAGKYDTAATLTIPSPERRAQQVAFIEDWLARFAKLDPARLSPKQRTDHALIVNKLNADKWYLTTLREFEWNPSMHNVAGPLDLILNSEYAAKPQRLRTLLRRLANVPAYYAAQESILPPAEKNQFAQRIAAAGSAVLAYSDFLTELDKKQQANKTARSFRIGKALYEQKFAHDIQASVSAEQMYRKALTARDELLARMDQLSDELWPKHMANTPKPADRYKKIGMMIDRLSANHVAPKDFFPEIRRQIPVLSDWVVKNNLLTLDPQKPLVVRETPLYQRGIAGASIEAPGPYRPQDRTFYNVTPLDGLTPEQAESTLREYNHWILQILNIHEAIPGHYAQLVYANKSPSLIKSLFGNGAMIEGWAVYGERMMLESGYGGNTPEMWLMYSKWNLRTVTNTILDYNVHVLGMTEPQAMDLLMRQAFQTRAQATEKWHRAKVSSVQLTSYFSGYSEIMDLREQRKQALGTRFVLKDFHEQFLSYGSAPVKTIRELMQ